MLGYNLIRTYDSLVSIGLVRSKRQFSRDYLSRGWSFLRDYEQRDRDGVVVSNPTVLALRTRLKAVAQLTPPGIADEINQVITAIDRDSQVTAILGLRRGGR
jgi:predicted secreted Zn-dependent protease